MTDFVIIQLNNILLFHQYLKSSITKFYVQIEEMKSYIYEKSLCEYCSLFYYFSHCYSLPETILIVFTHVAN
jgi:hypothetical protein